MCEFDVISDILEDLWRKEKLLLAQPVWTERGDRPASMLLHNVHCTMHNAHCTLHNAQCTLHNAHCTMHIAQCTVHNAQCTMHIEHCTLHIAHCTLHIAHCTLNIEHCTLQIAHCRLHIELQTPPIWHNFTHINVTLWRTVFCILLIFHHIAHFDADQFPAEKQCVRSTILQHCRANSTRLGAIDRDWPILFPLHVKIIIMYIFRDQIPNEDHTSTEIVWLKNYPQQAPVTKVWISSVLLFFRRVKETLRKSMNSLEQKINLVCKVFPFVFQKTNKTTLNLNFPQWCSHTSMENILTPVIVTGCLWGISASIFT